MCTICGRFDHHRVQCRARPYDIQGLDTNLVCVSCGANGHACCDGRGGNVNVTINLEAPPTASMQGACGNCGGDHWGFQCREPGLESLMRDPQAMERAFAAQAAQPVLEGATRIVRAPPPPPPAAGGGKGGKKRARQPEAGGQEGEGGKKKRPKQKQRSVPPQKSKKSKKNGNV
jgi:hypothetical protein